MLVLFCFLCCLHSLDSQISAFSEFFSGESDNLLGRNFTFSSADVKISVLITGAAEEATAIFGEAASLYVQKQYSAHGLASQSMLASTENKNPVPAKNLSLHDPSPRQVKSMHGNTLKDNSANYHGTNLSGGASSQFVNGGFANMSFYNTPSPMAAQVSRINFTCSF